MAIPTESCEPASQREQFCEPKKAGNGIFPYDENVVFRDSSFFKKHAALPSPTEVRLIATKSGNPRASVATRPPPVVFADLNLVVKYGTEITIAEGQCLLYVRNLLGSVVPVPEVFGWCKDGEQVFIYMEFLEGVTLEKSWDGLSVDERLSVSKQLRVMVDAWRGLQQDVSGPFIGHVGKQPLLDMVFTSSCSPTAGPFLSVSSFNDWFTSAYGPAAHIPPSSPHPYRDQIPDDVPIVFTHSDLHPSNILLSPEKDPRIVGIIDWHQSGWYPAYWEYCKVRWTSAMGEEWEERYLPMILEHYDCFDYWNYFVLARGV